MNRDGADRGRQRRWTLALATAAAIALAAARADAGVVMRVGQADTAWLSASAWSTGTLPAAGDLVQFGDNPSGTSVGIDASAAAGARVAVAAIQVTGSRLTPLTISDTAAAPASGVLTLAGTTVGGVGNVVLDNDGVRLLTVANAPVDGTGLLTLALGNATTNVLRAAGSGGILVSATVTGADRSVTVVGPGTVTLDATNAYGGGTTVASGKLMAKGTYGSDPQSTASATGTGTVTVSGGVLAGTGSVGAVDVRAGGTITAGTGATADDSTFTLTTRAQRWFGGGTYAWKVADSAGKPGSHWDVLAMSSLDLSNLGPGNKFTLALTKTTTGKFDALTPRSFLIATSANAISLPTNWSDLFVLTTSGLGVSPSQFSLSTGTASGGVGLYAVYTPTPEPAAVVLTLAGVAALAGRRRPRRDRFDCSCPTPLPSTRTPAPTRTTRSAGV